MNPSAGVTGVPQLGLGGEYTPEQVWAVVAYERTLSTAGESTTTTTGGDAATATTAANAETTTTVAQEG